MCLRKFSYSHCMEIYFVKLQIVSVVRGFESRRCHLSWQSSRAVPLSSTQPQKKEFQEYFQGGKGGRCVRLTTILPSSADCFEIWESEPPGTSSSRPGLYKERCLQTMQTLVAILDLQLLGTHVNIKEYLTCNIIQWVTFHKFYQNISNIIIIIP